MSNSICGPQSWSSSSPDKTERPPDWPFGRLMKQRDNGWDGQVPSQPSQRCNQTDFGQVKAANNFRSTNAGSVLARIPLSISNRLDEGGCAKSAFPLLATRSHRFGAMTSCGVSCFVKSVSVNSAWMNCWLGIPTQTGTNCKPQGQPNSVAPNAPEHVGWRVQPRLLGSQKTSQSNKSAAANNNDWGPA